MPSSESRRSSPARVWLRPGRRSLVLRRRPAVGPDPERRSAAPVARPGPGAAAEPAAARRPAARSGSSSPGLRPTRCAPGSGRPGYPENMLDDYVQGADTTTARAVRPADARRGAGARHPEPARRRTRSGWWTRPGRCPTRCARCSTRSSWSAPTRSAPTRWPIRVAVLRGGGLKLFGLETFRRATTRFQPAQAGPVDENYRLGPGDVLVLILTGDVERSYTLEVTREGFVVIPQVGQVYVANLTLGQLEDQLYGRLGRVYSGVRRGANATTQFQLSIAPAAQHPGLRRGRRGPPRRLPDLQRRHGAHRALRRRRPDDATGASGTSRSAAAARWWTASTSTTTCCTAATPPTSGSRAATWCSSRCTAASPRWRARSSGPAIYELLPGETLRDAIAFAGGFDPGRGAGPGHDPPDPAAGVPRPRRAGAGRDRGGRRPVQRRHGARGADGARRLGHRPRRRRPPARLRDRATATSGSRGRSASRRA